jgi:hypothetical protein
MKDLPKALGEKQRPAVFVHGEINEFHQRVLDEHILIFSVLPSKSFPPWTPAQLKFASGN